ncbi:alpha-N-acetylgalactosaminide alpha-2,6-sialyltransferase 1-like [Salarias fasciatus]|uniref:alpha-N-acetylgalactosaminide alpha-2,6-sialyltransferase n=1 Tax=Salarias fasciatus TaxID=181472 RepID=A0A672GCX1_SALFA|nr:alpha-N-acetylgalactosaminide alpha-2,6-sialyltransferase 1-like [Salarias fasciatus]XP_029954071.1 alpha-N-acetylgalactosaminide alpha-2,6-sialyltransferase 1-like [Salarias fasciatus]XP_029954072.1 alpha-N-acetylgalactosaminide alpha-2,6-sialyltransferase 1-like [Salarias fasciatus]
MVARRRKLLGIVIITSACVVLSLRLHGLLSNVSGQAALSSRAAEGEGSVENDLKGNLKQRVTAETPIPIIFRKSFNKLPQWDFEDTYNQDAPPRPTKCVKSLRNLKDEQFKKAFLPNLRLYLHKDNINVSEWNRLSHFNNPFGFMEYEYDEVMPSLKLIPKPKEPLLLPKPGGDGCVHCAVVGGGGILYGSKVGKEIDAHDYVFRVNGALTKGFEEDVGNKTSVYVHTAYSLTSSVSMLRSYGYTAAPHDEGIKYVLIPEQINDFQWLPALVKGERVPSGPFQDEWPRTYYSGQYNESRFYVLHQDFLRYVRNRFLKSESLTTTFWHVVRPTSGAFTLFLALHTCDTVSVYGFMTDNHEKYSNYYVEKDEKTKVTFFKKHDYLLEKETWKWLHNRKIIRLYQRTEADSRTEKQT